MDAEIRTFKDFLEIYNKMTEICFTHCINTLGNQRMTDDEKRCTDKCALKHINVNHSVMKLYMQIQPEFMNKKMAELNRLQQEQEQLQMLPNPS